MLSGALYRLSLQTNWERDEAHSAKIVAAKWREIWTEVNAMRCCGPDGSETNIQISNQMVINMQLAVTWRQIWLSASSTVSLAYYAIPATYSTDPGDVGPEINYREQALCLAVQGWINEVANYMESWLLSNFDEVIQAAAGIATTAMAISGLVGWPVLIGFTTVGIVAVEAFEELRSTVYRNYLVCRMVANLQGLDPDVRTDFEQGLDADTVGRPTPQSPQQDIARDAIEAYIRSQMNNLDNYLMFAGQMGTAMDIARSGNIEDCGCGTWAHTFDFTIDEQGFTAFELVPGDPRAFYDAGVGWGNFSAAGPWSHLIQIDGPAFASRHIISVEFFVTIPLTAPGKAFTARGPDVGGADFNETVNPVDEVQATVPIDATSDGWWIHVGVDDFNSYQGHIWKLIMTGTGIDPF